VAAYLKAFKYQLGTDNQTYDDIKARDTMYLDAVNEFTHRMQDLYDNLNRKKMSPTKLKVKNKDEMSFYAIAATIHMNHHFQGVVVEQNSQLQTNSIYDMMKNSLLKDKQMKPLAEHEEVLVNGINKEIMIEILKARVDILSALALGNLTDKRNMTLGQKARKRIFKITAGRRGSIDLPETYNELNDATKNWTASCLSDAVATKRFRVEIGHENSLEKN
jgi:hypothetical protein